VSHSQVFEYIYDRLRAAYQYFGVPQTPAGPLLTPADEDQLAQALIRDMQEANRRANSECDDGGGDGGNASNNSRQSSVENDDSEDVVVEGITEMSIADGDDDDNAADETNKSPPEKSYATVDELAADISQDVVDSALQKSTSLEPTASTDTPPQSTDAPSGNELLAVTVMQHLTEDQLLFHFNEEVLLDEGKVNKVYCCKLITKMVEIVPR
jgi:hypothetical protein